MTPPATTGVASRPASLPAAYFQRTSRLSDNVVFATPVPNTSPRTSGQSSAANDNSPAWRTANANKIHNLEGGVIQIQIIFSGKFDWIESSSPLLRRRSG